ncbi:inhibitor of growth protein 4 isoform X2 [Rhizophagus clarus]|uniref:Inhibitor of growth protein 4 isoform X2 n=1 Tax=Rhizophagus clarus TaxID=94130 RepID=A0A8H3QLQ5_9GLOM|nr:inhibitor of growth protein 4 isoform X2 [Rhizophagus clarus]
MDQETNDTHSIDNEFKSATEVLDDYIDSIYNLGSEVVQSLTELQILDEQLEKLRAIYKECQEKYFEILEESDQSDEEEKIVSYWKDKTEKAYDDALHKQDEKIAVADKLYSLISRHLERLDEELVRNNINLESKFMIQFILFIMWYNLFTIYLTFFVNSTDDDISDLEFDPNETLYCFCRRPEFGNMIQCDHPRCENAWYHWDCVGLTQQPSGQWFCPDFKVLMISHLVIHRFTEIQMNLISSLLDLL